jgi:hypothetical protein
MTVIVVPVIVLLVIVLLVIVLLVILVLGMTAAGRPAPILFLPRLQRPTRYSADLDSGHSLSLNPLVEV